MANFSKSLTVNGWTTLAALMIAAGYTGTNALESLQIINNNATSLYIHLTSDGVNHPATGTDGIPVGTSEPSASWSYNQATENFLDAGTTWLYTGSSVSGIRVAVIGGGI